MAEPAPLPPPKPAPPPLPVVKSAGHGGSVYVVNPNTGASEERSPEEAAHLVYSAGWTPVSKDDAAKIDSSGILREMATPADSITQGLARGLTGGLSDLLPRGAGQQRERAAVDEQFPWLTPISEAAGFLSPVGVGAELSAGGEAVAGAARGALGEGIGARVLGRAAGTAAEGSVYGGIQSARESQLEDTPLTAQKLLSGMFGGAAIGGALGAGLGAAEGVGSASKSLLRRFAGDTSAARDELAQAGLRDADVKAILERQGIPATPGALEEFQASLYNNPNITPEFLASIKNSPGIRDDVFAAAHPQRAAAEAGFAKALDDLHQVQDEAFAGWSGRLKREQAQAWIPPDEAFASDAKLFLDHMQALPVEARAQEVEKVIAAVKNAGSKDWEGFQDLMNTMGVSNEEQLTNNMRRALFFGDKNVVNSLLDNRLLNDEGVAAILKRERFHPTWKQASLDMLDKFGAAVGGLEIKPRGYVGEGAGGKIKELSGLFDGARSSILKGDRANAFAELDYVKKRLGAFRGEGYLRVGEGPEAMAQGMHEEARQFLERSDVWGDKAAGVQKSMNEILHKRLMRNDDFYQAFYDGSGAPDPRNPWAEGKVASPPKIQKMMERLVDPVNSQELAIFKKHIAETNDLADVMKKYYKLDGDQAKLVGRTTDAVKQAQDSMDAALHANLRINQGDALRKGVGIGQGGIGLAGMVGGLLFGRTGAALSAGARAAFDVVTNPGKSLYYRALLERALGGHGERVASALNGFAGKASAAASAVARSSGRIAGSIEKLGFDTVENQHAYHDTYSDLVKMAADRDTVVAELGKMWGPSLVHAPAAAMHMADSLQRAATFLLASAPVKPEPGLFGDEFGLVSDSEMNDWKSEVAAAMDPASILHMAASGTLTPAAVQAASATAPELVDDMRATVMHYVTTVGPSKLKGGARGGISILFGAPALPSLTPAYISLQQGLYAQASPPGGKGPQGTGETGLQTDYSKTTMSQSDRLESGEPPR